MIDNIIAAARASRAPILLPGTVYNYRPDAFPVLCEDSPQHPATRKCAIRVELVRRLEEASGTMSAPSSCRFMKAAIRRSMRGLGVRVIDIKGEDHETVR